MPHKDRSTKISENPGSRIVRCLQCNRAMPLKNCYIEMNINFHPEKQGQHLSMTAFPKLVGNKDNIDDLTQKLLLFKNVDFELSQNNKLVVNMKSHTSSSQRK